MSLMHKCERCGLIYETVEHKKYVVKQLLDTILFDIHVDLCPICTDKLQKFMDGACIMENSHEHCVPGAIYTEMEK